MTRQYRTPAERSAELEPRGRFSELRQECLAEVVRWRAYRGGKHFHRPEPLLILLHEQAARWMDELDASSDEGLPEDAVRVGFDTRDRPVIARAICIFPGQGKHQLLRYLDGYEEVVNTRWTESSTREVEVVHLWRDEAGRVVETRDHRDMIVTYRYDDAGRPLDAHRRHPGVEWGYRWEHDADGRLARIVSIGREVEPCVEWDARLHAHEPELRETVELLEAMGPGLAEAFAAGIAAQLRDVPDARCVVLRLGARQIPPNCVVLTTSYLRTMRRHAQDADAAFESALAHRADEGVHAVEAVDHAGPDVLRMLRQYEQGYWLDLWGTSAASAHAARHRLMAELARRLNDPAVALGLPVVLWDANEHLWELACSEPAWEPLRRRAARAMRRAEEGEEPGPAHNHHLWVPTIATAGQAAVEALWADIASYAGTEAPPTQPRAPPSDRAELVRLLPAAGLERVADAVAADARDAIVLVPGGAGARSVLGGVPALPVGMGWPHHGRGRPLTPLAAIDCAELPAGVQGRELLPEDGTLLLFADLHHSVDGDEEELGWGIRTPADGWIAVAHVPLGAPTETLEPPRELRERAAGNGPGVLDPMPVTARVVPTLRERWAAPRLLGLDAGEETSYVRLLELVQEAQFGAPQLLGHPLPVQEDPRAEGQELLFDFPPVRGLGDELIPGYGTLSFVVARDDLRARRWDRVRAVVATG